jgi:ATPase subunit of ABC transporter with duplicated ATPase domains
MITLQDLYLTVGSDPLQLSLKSGDKGVLVMPDQASSDALIRCLNGQMAPYSGAINLPEAEQYHLVSWPHEAEADQKLKAVLTQPYQRLLTSLRKYEQLSIQMSKHFSPMQLQGYMEDMEELEQLINQYDAWELEANLKDWQAGLALPDLSIPYDEASLQQQWAVLLTRAFVLPAPLTLLPDPTPWLNEEQQNFLVKQMKAHSAAWLVVSDVENSVNWPEAYRLPSNQDA